MLCSAQLKLASRKMEESIPLHVKCVSIMYIIYIHYGLHYIYMVDIDIYMYINKPYSIVCTICLFKGVY